MRQLERVRAEWGAFLDKAKASYIAKNCGRRVLDVGCGKGVYAEFLAERGFEVLGIDSETNLLPRRGKASYAVADVYSLPFKDSSFDTVLCLDVLEHLEDDVSGLREAARVARRNIVATVPNACVPRAFKLVGVTWCSREDPTHVRYYSEAELRELFKKVSLKPEIISWYPGSNTLIGLVKLVLRKIGVFPDYMVVATKDVKRPVPR